MRKEFVNQLLVQAENNQDIWLLTADLGFSFLERFEEAFPCRYINVGVAEQNLISVAAGLAMTGKKVFCYSIINFLTFRALEQIRQDICYPKLDVHLIGVGAGFSYKGAGYSHYAIEDIAIMKSLPHITIYSPADALQTAHVMKNISDCKTPSYVRLGKNQTTLHQPLSGSLEQGYIYHEGEDVVWITLGDILEELLALNVSFKKSRINPTIFSIALIKPFNPELFLHYAVKAKTILIFEHHKRSGLTSLIYQLKEQYHLSAAIISYALDDDAVDASKLSSLEAFIEESFR